MSVKYLNTVMALIGGVLLASMIRFNSQLAESSSPIVASWLAHGIGAVIALLLLVLTSVFSNKQSVESNKKPTLAPKWSYLGGVPGAVVVIIAAITVNSDIGLAGTLVLGLIGQVTFGLICDAWGLLGVEKNKITAVQVKKVILIVVGSMLIIFFRSPS
ncbi:DMT family transporter [Aliivibrio kagoshimensis]|uniref:DMT family transporter n=1 Tax=Aliivibrio kagoshimensis TaxID=2910230 RepID=UPI003D1253C8